MTDYLRKAVFLISMLLPFPLGAQDTEVQADVAISVQPLKEIWAGQQVTLDLDLKTTGFSFSNSHFNLPEVSGAFLMQTDTTTIKLTEKIDAQDWQIVRYPLALYPQKSGQLEIPSIDVRFITSAGFGSTEKAFEFQTKPLELTINLPPGVKEGDMLVTTSAFELDHSWQPESETAQTGDAFTLTVKRRANDISAMLLPPLPVFRTTGLAAYPQAPEVSDKTNRGDLTGERTDSIIWVVEKPGVYNIPGIRFQWWDPARRELRQQIVAGISLDIPISTTDKNVTEPAGISGESFRNLLPLLVLLITVIFVGALWLRFGPKTHDQIRNNEKSAFTGLQKACRSNRASETHSAIYTWLSCFPLATVSNLQALTLGQFASKVNDKQLATELQKLQVAMTSASNNWQGSDLLSSLKRVRFKINRQKIVRSKAHLAPLNP